MRILGALILWGALAAGLSGCVPYPVYKKLLPEATVKVVDGAGAAIAGARVELVSSAYPYGHEKSRDFQQTDARGEARFGVRREWRTESLMIHGGESYFWNWCVRREGYVTFFTSHTSARQFQDELVVRLVSGVSSPCPQPNR